MIFGKKIFPLSLKEKSSDHILIHYIKKTLLWHLLFSLFGMLWMIPFLAKKTLLEWHGSFVGKKTQKDMAGCFLALILDNLEGQK